MATVQNKAFSVWGKKTTSHIKFMDSHIKALKQGKKKNVKT